jgi:hypothetical protein
MYVIAFDIVSVLALAAAPQANCEAGSDVTTSRKVSRADRRFQMQVGIPRAYAEARLPFTPQLPPAGAAHLNRDKIAERIGRFSRRMQRLTRRGDAMRIITIVLMLFVDGCTIARRQQYDAADTAFQGGGTGYNASEVAARGD